MGNDFEWVSEDNKNEESSKLPAPVKLRRIKRRIILKKILNYLWYTSQIILSIFARFILYIARVKIPNEYIKNRSTYLLYLINSKIPTYKYDSQKNNRTLTILRQVLHGLSFVFTLCGIGAIFSTYENGLSYLNALLLFLGFISVLWLVIKSSTSKRIFRNAKNK